MKALEQFKNRLKNTWENTGWSYLWKNAREAMTRFTPIRNKKSEDKHQFLSRLTGTGWGMLASDLYEDDENLYVRVEIPGLESKNINLSLQNNDLLIEGRKQYEKKENEGNFHMMECAFGHFERKISLPQPVKESEISAKYKQGVLTVILPKQINKANRRAITVQ